MKDTLASNQYITIMKEVLDAEAQAILGLKDTLNGEMARIIEVLLSCKGRVIVTGIGKSGIIGRKIAATLASTGTPSLFMHPSEGLHGDLGMVTKSDVVFALSNSGESEEILHLIPSLKRMGVNLIAFVGNENSTLAKKSDYVLCIGRVKEACPLELAPTTSTTLMLSVGDAIAIALLKARNFTVEDFAVYHPGGLLGKKLLLTVNTIIEVTKKNPLLHNTCTVKEALFNMTKSGLGATSIVNNDGVLIGIVTDGDIRRALANSYDLLSLPIAQFYNTNPLFVQEDVMAYEALSMMQSNNINVIPVVNRLQKPIGMVQLQDITRLGF